MHREELKNSDFKQTQLASLQVELGKANSNKASFRQIDLNLRATLLLLLAKPALKNKKKKSSGLLSTASAEGGR